MFNGKLSRHYHLSQDFTYVKTFSRAYLAVSARRRISRPTGLPRSNRAVGPARALRLVHDPRGDLGPRVESQLGHDVGDMPGRGGVADGQLVRDGLVAAAAGQQLGDLVLPLGQRARRR